MAFFNTSNFPSGINSGRITSLARESNSKTLAERKLFRLAGSSPLGRSAAVSTRTSAKGSPSSLAYSLRNFSISALPLSATMAGINSFLKNSHASRRSCFSSEAGRNNPSATFASIAPAHQMSESAALNSSLICSAEAARLLAGERESSFFQTTFGRAAEATLISLAFKEMARSRGVLRSGRAASALE